MTRYYWWMAVVLVVAVWSASAWLYPSRGVSSNGAENWNRDPIAAG